MPSVASGKKSASLNALRRRLVSLDPFSAQGSNITEIGAPGVREGQENEFGAAVMPLGIPVVDGHLPWGGLPRAALHEIIAASEPAAAGFAAVLLGRLIRRTGRAVVWCRRPARGFRPALYGAGLARFGLTADRLIVVQGADRQSILWTMEECLGSRAVAAVLGEVDRVDGRTLRRLQLAAEKTGVTALLLRPKGAAFVPGPMVTRWQVAGAADPRGNRAGNGAAWHVDLLKCRGGGQPGAWNLLWSRKGGLVESLQ